MKSMKFITLVSIALASAQMTASALTYGLNSEFSGGTAPSGSGSWATVSVTDDGAGVLVKFTISDSSSIGKLTQWYLNYNPSYDPSKLQIQAVDSSAVGSWSVDTGLNKFKADGDGIYDIRFNFASSGNLFQSGESLEFRITTAGTDLNGIDFSELSIGGARGGFHSAAHAQALSDGASGWIGDKPEGNYESVPDGSWTVLLLGIGAFGLEIFRRFFARVSSRS